MTTDRVMHSGGPWRVDKDDPCAVYTRCHHGRRIIASTDGKGRATGGHDMNIENARLIAQAPAMLYALRKIRRDWILDEKMIGEIDALIMHESNWRDPQTDIRTGSPSE